MDREARLAKSSFVMVKLTHRSAEPAAAVGRLINRVPVIERVWGLRSIGEELYENHIPIFVN